MHSHFTAAADDMGHLNASGQQLRNLNRTKIVWQLNLGFSSVILSCIFGLSRALT